jgi:predicted DCC family thiol-disulfide oxidoreductase YuxK
MTTNFPLTLLYDGACPVCNLEMDNLKARNTAGMLKFVDIAAPFFDPAPYGTSQEAMNGLIHAVRPDGSLVIGVEVFRLAYGAVGLGHLAAPTGWPLLRPAFDAAYKVFARNRYGFSAVFMPVLEHLRTVRATARTAQVDAAAQQATQAASACHTAGHAGDHTAGQCDLPSTPTPSTTR